MDIKSLLIGILLATVLFLATGFGGENPKYSAFHTGQGYAILNCETGILKTFIPGKNSNFFAVEINYEKETFARRLGKISEEKAR
jgi:hypothetical protein